MRALLCRAGLPEALRKFIAAEAVSVPSSPASPFTSTGPSQAPGSELVVSSELKTTARRVQELLSAGGPSDSFDSGAEGQSDTDYRLKTIAASLRGLSRRCSPAAAAEDVLIDLCSLLAFPQEEPSKKTGSLSTYEFVNSGIVEALVQFLLIPSEPELQAQHQ
eukprot:RCo036224